MESPSIVVTRGCATETETDRQTETDRDRQRQRQTETDRDRQRQTETDRDRDIQRQTGTSAFVRSSMHARMVSNSSIGKNEISFGTAIFECATGEQ